MEQGFDSEPIDRSKILNIKPLRSLAPVFPSPPGMSFASNPQASFPFVCVPPTGPFPPAPLNAFRTPDTANGSTGRAMRGGRSQAEDGFSDELVALKCILLIQTMPH
ncbi:hypothetical protein LIER_15097 [Lithospermum erythrorhizon]|uniref:Uncharacterized protein n=1 Tax=Lithospermum erythrorhizon TaxID=34254 RepID=A0AAV3Q2I8_LITER